MTCPTCSYYSAHGCVLGLVLPCSRYSPGVEALEAWLRCECGGWIEVTHSTGHWQAWCTGCLKAQGDHSNPVAALVAFHERRKR